MTHFYSPSYKDRVGTEKKSSLNAILHRGVGWMHVRPGNGMRKEDLQVGIVVFQAGHRNHLHDAPSSIYPSNQHNNDRFTKLDSPIRKFFGWRCCGEWGRRAVSEKSLKARGIGIWARQQRKKRERWTSGILGVGGESGWMDGWIRSSPSIISTSLPNFHPLKHSGT